MRYLYANHTFWQTALLTIALLFAANFSHARDHGPLDGSNLIGWSNDGQFAAISHHVGYWGGPNWRISYAQVIDNFGSDEFFYQLKNSTNAKKYVPQKWREYLAMKPRADWSQFAESKLIRMPDSRPTSPSGKWSFSLSVIGTDIALSSMSTTGPKLDPEIWGDSIYEIPGKIISYSVSSNKLGKAKARWVFLAFVTNGEEKILLHSAPLSTKKNGGITGAIDGVISVHWGPGEKSVGIQWTVAPIAGGGFYTDAYHAILP